MSSISEPRVSNGLSGSSPMGNWPDMIIVPPTSEENVAESRFTSMRSACFTTFQYPPPLNSSGCQYTGSSARSRRNISWCSSRLKRSGSLRSMPSMTVRSMVPPRRNPARLFDLMNYFGRRTKVDSAQEGRERDGGEVALVESVEDRRQRLDRARMPEVQAHDRARVHGRERALRHRGRAGILVVERVHVEAEHSGVPGFGRDGEHLVPRRHGAVVGARRSERSAGTAGEPYEDVAAAHHFVELGVAREPEEGRMRVGVVGELVAAVGDALRHGGVGLE